MIGVVLNGESRKVEKEVSLNRLLDLFSLPRQRVAIELNGSVIRRADWPQTFVAEGDVIEIIHFVGGG
jgi:thiamine biosynthesis protein ThiS